MPLRFSSSLSIYFCCIAIAIAIARPLLNAMKFYLFVPVVISFSLLFLAAFSFWFYLPFTLMCNLNGKISDSLDTWDRKVTLCETNILDVWGRINSNELRFQTISI